MEGEIAANQAIAQPEGAADAFRGRSAAAFEWTINTPFGEIVVFDAVYPEIIAVPVLRSRTTLRFWTNHANRPDKIAIGIAAEPLGSSSWAPSIRPAKRKPQPLPAAALSLQDN